MALVPGPLDARIEADVMSDHENNPSAIDESPKSTSRRQFFGAAGAAGVIGAGLALGVSGCRRETASAPTPTSSEHKPGSLDEYMGSGAAATRATSG